LSWCLTWGRYEKTLQKASEKGEHVPALDEQVELFPDLYPIWTGFFELCRTRQCGMSANPLSLNDIVHWLDINGIESQDRRKRYCSYFLAMDTVMLKHHKDST